MRRVHITEDTLNGRKEKRSFIIAMVIVWLWPLVLLLCTFRWSPDCALRLLCKSSWVLFAGVLQGWCVLAFHERRDRHPDPRIILWVVLSVVSLFLLPFGLRSYDSFFGPDYWDYLDDFLISFIIHLSPLGVCAVLTGGGEVPSAGTHYSSGVSGQWKPDNSWYGREISDDFYGHRGEFDRNDESRRISEDIQQFHNAHPDADLTDHYNWEDVLDAETDGYLD